MESSKVKGKRIKLKAFGWFKKPSLLGRVWVGLLVSFLMTLSSVERCAAQSFSFSDLFGQGDKEMKNMLKQIAALSAFEASVRQGYNELRSEWTAVGNWKNSEFGMHQSYYNSLSQVNPLLQLFADDGSIASEQQSMIGRFAAVRNLPGLKTAEQTYVRQVEQMVLSDCAKAVNDLREVTTSRVWVMSDDERIRRVSAIADEVKTLYEFTCRFVVRVRLLAAQRRSETDELQNLKGWYGND